MRVAIVGGGVFGLSAALALAKRGCAVELFEAETIPAPLAASNDVSKATRLLYGRETARYAPRVLRATEGWRELERETGRTLLAQPGFLALAREWTPGGFEQESAAALARLGLPHEVLDARAIAARHPALSRVPASVGLLDPNGGFFDPPECLLALREAAARRGARIVEHRAAGEGFRPAADAVLWTKGPWLAAGGLPLRATLQEELLFAPRGDPGAIPVWSSDIASAGIYGFPRHPRSGLFKVACHALGPAVDPSAPRSTGGAEHARIRAFVAGSLPWLDPDPRETRTCLYSNTPDGEFLFDELPASADTREFVAGGGSGHAFKFGPLLGEWAADLVIDGRVPDAFRLARSPHDRVV